MFDAGIISRPALSSNSGSPVSSERMSTPQTPRAMIGAVKTSVRSARSRATAAEALVLRRGSRRCGTSGKRSSGAAAQPAENVTATHATVADDPRRRGGPVLVTVSSVRVIRVSVARERRCRRFYLMPSSDLTMLSIVASVDLGGAWLAVARGVTVGCRCGQKLTFSTRLPWSDVSVIDEFRLVEPGLGRAVDEARGARRGDRRDQVVDRGLIDVASRRRRLLPLLFVLAFLVLRFRLLERRGLAVARHLETRRIEGAAVEEILLPILAGVLGGIGRRVPIRW